MAVLVAVACRVLCVAMRNVALDLSQQNPINKGFLRNYACLCDTVRKSADGTQNPPRATSWGVDPSPGTKFLTRHRRESVEAGQLAHVASQANPWKSTECLQVSRQHRTVLRCYLRPQQWRRNAFGEYCRTLNTGYSSGLG